MLAARRAIGGGAGGRWLRLSAESAQSGTVTDFPPLHALIFAALGIAIFFAACAQKFAPFDVRKHVAEEANMAAAIVVGAAMLGIGWIITAAMH